MNQIVDAVNKVSPTTEKVMNDSVTFSPRRWKSGWPFHLRHVPPFRDDATASITRAEVFNFAAGAVASGYAREQVIDFIGAAFAYGAGQSQAVLPLQQFLRNKAKAASLLKTIPTLESKEPAAQYEALTKIGLPAKFASYIAYFLAGPQAAGEDKPLVICSNRAKIAGLEKDSDWSAADYGTYLAAVREARDSVDPELPLDAVEWAMRESVR